MYIINRRKNIRLIGDEHHIGDDFEFVIYKVQIKVLWFWVTIKEFDEDEYYDAVDCFRYCTNPYEAEGSDKDDTETSKPTNDNRGISRKYNPTWQGWTMIDSYKKHYTVGSKEFKSKLDNDVQLQKLVWEKYKIGYWDVFELDDFNSQRVAEQLFDTNVNCGQVAAIKMAQRVLGLKETGRWNLYLLNKLIEIKD